MAQTRLPVPQVMRAGPSQARKPFQGRGPAGGHGGPDPPPRNCSRAFSVRVCRCGHRCPVLGRCSENQGKPQALLPGTEAWCPGSGLAGDLAWTQLSLGPDPPRAPIGGAWAYAPGEPEPCSGPPDLSESRSPDGNWGPPVRAEATVVPPRALQEGAFQRETELCCPAAATCTCAPRPNQPSPGRPSLGGPCSQGPLGEKPL